MNWSNPLTYVGLAALLYALALISKRLRKSKKSQPKEQGVLTEDKSFLRELTVKCWYNVTGWNVRKGSPSFLVGEHYRVFRYYGYWFKTYYTAPTYSDDKKRQYVLIWCSEYDPFRNTRGGKEFNLEIPVTTNDFEVVLTRM